MDRDTALSGVTTAAGVALDAYAASQVGPVQAALDQATAALAAARQTVAADAVTVAALTAQVADLTAQLAALQPPAWQPPVGASQALYPDAEQPWSPGVPDLPKSYYSRVASPGDTVNAAFAKAAKQFPGTLFVVDVAGRVSLAQGFAEFDSAMFQCGQLGMLGLAGLDRDKTILTMPAKTSASRKSATSGTTPWRAVKYSGQSMAAVKALYFGNFTLECTEQGAEPNGGLMFHGLSVYHPNADLVMVGDVKVTGWCGRGGSPPQEVFGVEVQCDPTRAVPTKVRYVRVETDGRRADGLVYGSAGFTIEDCADFIAWDCNSHHVTNNAVVGWQAKNLRYYRCTIGDPVSNGKPGSNPSPLGTGGRNNFERCTGVQMFDCAYNSFAADGSQGMAIQVTFSNDQSDGTLRIVNPTVADSWPGSLPKGLHVQSWRAGPYVNSAQQSPPVVLDAHGQPAKGWDWRNGDQVTAKSY